MDHEEKEKNTNIDFKILSEAFWALIFGNLANFLFFIIKTNDKAVLAIMKILDRIIFPIIGMFLVWRIESKMQSTWRSKLIAYIVIPMVLIVGAVIMGIDVSKNLIEKGPDCKPQSQLIQLYERFQIEMFYDVTQDVCQK